MSTERAARAAIDMEGLTKRYGRRRGIADISLIVERGEAFGFLGPNGAGKTTTIRLLLDLIRPTSGTARVLGLDTHAQGAEVRRRVGYLPGDVALPRRPRGREYLAYLGALRGGVERAAIDGLAERLQCDLEARIGSLSHGNRQKIGLIQALMHSPDVLVLDEPTQGLDPLVQHEFHGIVQEATRAGRTVFLSSHVLPEVQTLCDRVAIIQAGRLAAVEDVGALAARAVRAIEIHFARPVPAAVFANLAGVQSVSAHGDVVRCEVVGSLDLVIKTAARFDVVDVTSHEAGLEEAFMAFYREQPHDAA